MRELRMPKVLVVDDVQWIDAPTNDVLAFISRRVRHDPVMMVTALRDGHVAAVCAADAREINLTGLDEDSSRELLMLADPGLTAIAGPNGAGALVNVMAETKFGYFALKASKPFCVSCRLPATSTILIDTGSAAWAAVGP